jgi:nitrite reductase/ring-hydroxylating ferredoxin subunit
VTVRIDAGPAADIPSDRCVAVGDGAVVVVRVGDVVRAFRNRCLHQDSPLAEGWVRGGVLTCPQHFWRYGVDDGAHMGGRGCLDRFDTDIVDGHVVVIVPDPAPPLSLREQLLARASTYDRDAAHRADVRPRST